MSQLTTNFFIGDAAEAIADLIRDEEAKLRLATRKRDQHRAETTIRAHKEALALVLLERECRDGNPHPMPDVDKYLKAREKPPVV